MIRTDSAGFAFTNARLSLHHILDSTTLVELLLTEAAEVVSGVVIVSAGVSNAAALYASLLRRSCITLNSAVINSNFFPFF